MTDNLSASPYKVGDTVDGIYQLVELIGVGGMGEVFKAHHIMLDQVCAVKILTTQNITDDELKRFELEVKALAKLQNPGIVQVYNMGRDRGRYPYYAMELLSGESLAQYLKKYEVMEATLCLSIFKQLADSLASAHQSGIVHRDIKPSNIMLVKSAADADYRVKLVDFGIARLSGHDTQNKQSLTAPGLVLGTPLYMSPEQSRGEAVDARSDIYSLGCSLFEALTGSPPFKGESAFATMLLHQTATVPSLFDRNPDLSVPADLDRTLQRMLAKEPAMRIQRMEQVAKACERLLAGKSATPLSTGKFADKNAAYASDVLRPRALWQTKDFAIKSTCAVLVLLACYSAFSFYKIHSTPKLAGKSYRPQTFQTMMPVGTSSVDKKPKQFFSKLVTRDSKVYRVYEFPLDDWVCKLSVKGAHVIPGVGHVEIPDGQQMTVWMSSYGDEVLDEIKCFSEDPISCLHVSEVDLVKLAGCLSKFKSLKTLALSNSKVTGAGLDALFQLRQLDFLSLDNCDIDEKAFIASPLLDKLESLSITKGEPSAALFCVLQKKPNIKALYLQELKLSEEALAAISKIKSLDRLEFRECGLKPGLAVKYLTPFKNIDILSIYEPSWKIRDWRDVYFALPRVGRMSDDKPDKDLKERF